MEHIQPYTICLRRNQILRTNYKLHQMVQIILEMGWLVWFASHMNFTSHSASVQMPFQYQSLYMNKDVMSLAGET